MSIFKRVSDSLQREVDEIVKNLDDELEWIGCHERNVYVWPIEEDIDSSTMEYAMEFAAKAVQMKNKLYVLEIGDECSSSVLISARNQSDVRKLIRAAIKRWNNA
jgi:hypothetical protein